MVSLRIFKGQMRRAFCTTTMPLLSSDLCPEFQSSTKKSIFFLILRNGILKFEIGKMLFPTLVVIWSQLVKSGATSGQQQCQSFSTDNFYCKNVNYNQTFFPHRILESERIRTQVNTYVVRFEKPLNHLSGSGCCCDYWSLTNYWPLKTTENFQWFQWFKT